MLVTKPRVFETFLDAIQVKMLDPVHGGVCAESRQSSYATFELNSEALVDSYQSGLLGRSARRTVLFQSRTIRARSYIHTHISRPHQSV